MPRPTTGHLRRPPGSPYWYYEFKLDGKTYRGPTGQTERLAAERVLEREIRLRQRPRHVSALVSRWRFAAGLANSEKVAETLRVCAKELESVL